MGDEMNRDGLRKAYLTAFARHWPSSRDRGGPTPALVDECVAIAVAHAGRVTARQELRTEATASRAIAATPDEADPRHWDEAAKAALVAGGTEVTTGGPGHARTVLADGTIVGGGGGSDAPGPAIGGGGTSGTVTTSGGPGSARTRTRTRRSTG